MQKQNAETDTSTGQDHDVGVANTVLAKVATKSQTQPSVSKKSTMCSQGDQPDGDSCDGGCNIFASIGLSDGVKLMSVFKQLGQNAGSLARGLKASIS